MTAGNYTIVISFIGYDDFRDNININKGKNYKIDAILSIEPILMTNGTKNKFCHRHLVADWLQNKLNFELEEYKIGKVSRQNGYMKKTENPTLFE